MNTPRQRVDIGLLVLRVGLGFAMMMHGYQKVFTFGLTGIAGGFTRMGIPLASVSGPGIALLEFVGGILLMLGLGTRVVSVLFVCDMLGAMYWVHFRNGFFLPTGYEFVATLAVAALSLAIAGPGALSLDAIVHRRKSST